MLTSSWVSKFVLRFSFIQVDSGGGQLQLNSQLFRRVLSITHDDKKGTRTKWQENKRIEWFKKKMKERNEKKAIWAETQK